MGIWEQIHNPCFNYGEFAIIRSNAGLNSYKISAKEWTEKTNAIGIFAKAGRYGGTYAYKDIAFEFGMWISPEFKIYLIKENLIPKELTRKQVSVIYASEADVLNVALFGMTAKQWRDNNPNLKGNIRDYASINELICLSNMENINAVLIEDKVPQNQRLMKLNKIAIHQMTVLGEKQDYKYIN